MAAYSVAASEHGIYGHRLTAGVVDTVTFASNVDVVEIAGDGAAAVYVTVDGSVPTVAGGHTWELPGRVRAVRTIVVHPTVNTVVKLISAGAPFYSVAAASELEIELPRVSLGEEERAAAFRTSLRSRAAARAARCAGLAGDAEAAAAVRAAWRPYVLARLQPDVLPDGLDDDDECGPCGRLLGN